MAGKGDMEKERREGRMETNEDSGMQSSEEYGARLKKPTDLLKAMSLPIASTNPSLHVPTLNQPFAMLSTLLSNQ